VKQVQAAEVSQRRTAVSSKCFQLYYTCSDRLLAIALPSYSFHIFPPLTVTFPKLSVILRPLYLVSRSTLTVVNVRGFEIGEARGTRKAISKLNLSQSRQWFWRTTEENKAKDNLEKNSDRGSRKSRQNMEGREEGALALLCWSPTLRRGVTGNDDDDDDDESRQCRDGTAP
jgi:hypothetical protein